MLTVTSLHEHRQNRQTDTLLPQISMTLSIVQRLPIALLAFFCVCPSWCEAGGLLHVFPPTLKAETFAVARPNVVHSSNILTVAESWVEYRFDQTFFNDNEFPLQGVFVLPVPNESSLLTPEVRVNGLPAPFHVISAEDFFPTLRALTEGMQDPALLDLAGKTVLVIRSVNLGIRKQIAFRIKFKVPFQVRNNTAEFTVPLIGERFSLGPVDFLEVLVRFKMSQPVRNLFSPTHHLSIMRETSRRCLVTATSEKKRVIQDFQLLTTFSDADLDLKIFTHRRQGENGTFMAMVAPPLMPSSGPETDKDVVFALDASGSTMKRDLEAAKTAVIFGLGQLRTRDRFNVMILQTKQKRLSDNLIPATADNIRDAVNFVNTVSSKGGTDLYNGLMNALEQFRGRKRSCLIVLVGDGRRTVGIIDPETIIDDIKHRNRVRARIFALALGVGADVPLLDKLALGSKGNCLHFSDKEDLTAVLRKLFAGIAPPQITDPALEFRDIVVEGIDSEPGMMGPDGLAVFGGYNEKSDVRSKVLVKGKIKGRIRTQAIEALFPLTDERRPYISAIRAMRRIAKLMEKDWLKGPDLSAREEIGVLSREFGFKNPFPQESPSGESTSVSLHKNAGELLWLFKTSRVAADVLDKPYRAVNDKIFRSGNGTWIDNSYRSTMPSKKIRFLSEEYFSLLRQTPTIGKYLAIGSQVTFVHNNEALIVTETDSR